MASEETHHQVVVTPPDKERIRRIWKVALILGIVTAIEFLFAFTMPRGVLLIAIFIGLTIVKAFYIVGEFMHLKHEVKVLIWSILVPVIFIIWLIIALLVEGNSILIVR
jgi:caa(3)-type oxidase subunit IV